MRKEQGECRSAAREAGKSCRGEIRRMWIEANQCESNQVMNHYRRANSTGMEEENVVTGRDCAPHRGGYEHFFSFGALFTVTEAAHLNSLARCNRVKWGNNVRFQGAFCHRASCHRVSRC